MPDKQVYGPSSMDSSCENLAKLRVWRLPCLNLVLRRPLQSRISEAIGAKRTWQERRERGDLTKLTHLRHQRAIFAVMHSGILAHRRGNVRP
jgi:hypothetical protein